MMQLDIEEIMRSLVLNFLMFQAIKSNGICFINATELSSSFNSFHFSSQNLTLPLLRLVVYLLGAECNAQTG